MCIRDSLTASHPEGLGAKLVMRNALEDAEMDPKEVDYINVHGTCLLYTSSADARTWDLQSLSLHSPI